MKKSFPRSIRLIACAAMFAAAASSALADEPGVVFMYADGTQQSHPLSAITRMEIGSDNVTLVHSAGSETRPMAEIDRILIGTAVASISELPQGATLAVWPTLVNESFNVLPAENCTISVFDLNGRLVAGPVSAAKGETLTVDASDFGTGYYLVKIGGQTVKIVKN